MTYKLLNGDCLERMKEIPVHSVDLILTDPPYGTTTEGVCNRGENPRLCDCVIPFAPMWDELKRIIKRRRVIKTYTKPGETVLDFTMGSASTGIAALNTGRNFIGIERDKKYYETARRRMKDAVTRGEAVNLCDL